jgi:hypothetical protein
MTFLATPAAAEVRTVDGDTLKLGGTIYRLWGIDAAEKSQKCADGWRAGIEARTTLRQLIAGRAPSPASHGRRTAMAAPWPCAGMRCSRPGRPRRPRKKALVTGGNR